MEVNIMKQIEITYEKLMKLHDEFVISTKKEKKNIEKEIAEFLAKDILEDVKRAYTQIINNWYASYSPSIYDRKETLKDTGKFILNGSKITIYASSDPMNGHRLDNDRLFKLTMLQGYHGGAWHNGTPMYRGPVPSYYMWTRPAEKTFSPARAMANWIKSYQYRPVTKKINKIEEIFRKYYSKYDYFKMFF